MDYETFIDEVQRRAGPVSRTGAEDLVGAYLETLCEILPGETSEGLASCLPEELAGYLKGEGGEEFSVWEFYERLARKAGIAPEHATRYARHVGSVLREAVPEDEMDAARQELPVEYWELAERVLPDPNYYGSFSRQPDSLKASDAPVAQES